MKNPSNLLEFYKEFATEQDCIDYLVRERWGDEVTCPRCGLMNTKLYKLATGKLKCAACRQVFSVRVGTIFEDSKLPLQQWFLAVYLATSLKKGISSVQLSKYLDITQKSAWFMLQRIRYAVSSDGEPLTGEIEVDETYPGGKSENRAFREPKRKPVVFGMVERGGRAKIQHVKSSGARVLLPEIGEGVTSGSTIYSDGWQAYKTLSRRGYEHHTVDHHAHQYVVGRIYTQNIENVWSQLKRSVYGIYHHVSEKHLQLYCNETTYRYNTREMNDGERFKDWFRFAASKRLKYESLVG